MLEREPGPGAAQPGLDLVEDHQHVVRVAHVAHPGEPAVGRNDDAGLALDGLDQHRDGRRRDRLLQRGEVAERHGAEARREWAEAVAIVGLGGECDHRGGAAVKVSGCDDDLGAVARHALDLIAPAARRLDRGLDRFGAGIHRQGGIKAGQPGQLGKERAQPVAVVGA